MARYRAYRVSLIPYGQSAIDVTARKVLLSGSQRQENAINRDLSGGARVGQLTPVI